MRCARPKRLLPFFPHFVYNILRMGKNTHTAKSLQKAFLKEAGPNLDLLKAIFNNLPFVATYIKDSQGRFMAMNPRNCEQCGFPNEATAIGKRSCDLFPPEIATSIMERDKLVRETGKPLLNLKSPRTARNAADPITISVYPVRNAAGAVIGTAAFYYKAMFDKEHLHKAHKIKDAIAYLQSHYHERIVISLLPKLFSIPQSQFYHDFRVVTKTSPNRYLVSLRIREARQLLETTHRTIADIATGVGFFDHSHFIRTFISERGITPSEYRLRHQQANSQTSKTTEPAHRKEPPSSDKRQHAS